MTGLASPLLALDSGSPLVSVAIGDGTGAPLAARAELVERSSTRLLQLIHEALEEAGLAPRDLGGLVALAGPGSFTGLRIGLATAFGLHQALGLPAAAVPTLRVLAASILLPPAGAPRVRAPEVRALGAVDALRGEWSVQPFDLDVVPRAIAEPEIRAPARFPRLASGPIPVVGFGTVAAAERPEWPAGFVPVEPGALAPAALALAALEPPSWDATALTRPFYARPPAATLPARARHAPAS